MNAWLKPLSIVIAIGSPKAVEKISSSINNENIDFPNIISPDTKFLDASHISFGKGNLICSNCLFSTNIQIGDFNVFNGFITVGHDAVIGNYNSIMPSVRISGEVKIGDGNYFGVGSIVLQQIKIGCDTVIGANSLIIRKTKDELLKSVRKELVKSNIIKGVNSVSLKGALAKKEINPLVKSFKSVLSKAMLKTRELRKRLVAARVSKPSWRFTKVNRVNTAEVLGKTQGGFVSRVFGFLKSKLAGLGRLVLRTFHMA